MRLVRYEDDPTMLQDEPYPAGADGSQAPEQPDGAISDDAEAADTSIIGALRCGFAASAPFV